MQLPIHRPTSVSPFVCSCYSNTPGRLMPRIARFWDTLPRFGHQIRRKSQTDLAGSEESYLYWPRFLSHRIGGGGNSGAADAYKSTHIVAFAMIRATGEPEMIQAPT
jgi:hypothetical protein